LQTPVPQSKEPPLKRKVVEVWRKKADDVVGGGELRLRWFKLLSKHSHHMELGLLEAF
jgi:hypothetical protein